MCIGLKLGASVPLELIEEEVIISKGAQTLAIESATR